MRENTDHRVLIVEDEPKLREVLSDYFASKGDAYDVTFEEMSPIAHLATSATKYMSRCGLICVNIDAKRGQIYAPYAES